METHTISRMFDDGGMVALNDVTKPDGSSQELALATGFCANPECDCRDIDLDVRPIERGPGDASRVGPRPPLALSLDLDSGELAIRPRAEADAGASERLDTVRRLLRDDVLELLRRRWSRVKGQHSDEWRDVDWNDIDLSAMVPFLEIFPSRWDLSLVSEHQRYWIVDSWCLEPRCACDEVGIELVREQGHEPLGFLRVDLRRFRVTEAGAALRCLAEELLGDAVIRRQLAERRKLIRKVARELPRFLSPPTPSAAAVAGPARNAPCPCGSGRKYKRCCGA